MPTLSLNVLVQTISAGQQYESESVSFLGPPVKIACLKQRIAHLHLSAARDIIRLGTVLHQDGLVSSVRCDQLEQQLSVAWVNAAVDSITSHAEQATDAMHDVKCNYNV